MDVITQSGPQLGSLDGLLDGFRNAIRDAYMRGYGDASHTEDMAARLIVVLLQRVGGTVDVDPAVFAGPRLHELTLDVREDGVRIYGYRDLLAPESGVEQL